MKAGCKPTNESSRFCTATHASQVQVGSTNWQPHNKSKSKQAPTHPLLERTTEVIVNDNENIEVVEVQAATPSIDVDSQHTNHQEAEEESKSMNQAAHDTNDVESNQELTEEALLEQRRYGRFHRPCGVSIEYLLSIPLFLVVLYFVVNHNL